MALSWVLVVAGLVLTLAAAHPHPHPHPHPHTHAMCVVKDGRSYGARHLLGGRLPHCLRDIKPFKQHRSVLRHCKSQVKKRLIMDRKEFKKDLLDPETMEGVMAEAWEGVAACLVERLHLEAEDGTLNTKQLIRATAGMGGRDVWKVKYMRAMVITCAANTTADNATQQLREVMGCVREGAMEFCERKMAFARQWLKSSAEESVCSPVVVPPEPREACVACAKELSVSETICSEADSDTEEEEEEATMYYTKGLGLDEAEWAVRLCSIERLGWYRPADGFLFTEMSDAIANFTGWGDIIQARDNLTQAIEDCAPPLEGDVLVQAVLWTSCFMTTFFDTCGFRSNLTALFFPGLQRTMNNEVRQLVRGLVEVGELGDEEEEPDERDAELVDAGLLERSLLGETLVEDTDAEAPRVRSANMQELNTGVSSGADKQSETKADLNVATSEPSQDASSDMPPEVEPSGAPPGEVNHNPTADLREQMSSDGEGLDPTSRKPLQDVLTDPLE